MVFLAFLLIVANMAPGPVTGRTFLGCEASGSSDGVSAEAVAACSAFPDGLILDPLNPDSGCSVASYELVVADDTAVAVFPNDVVADYSAQLDPELSAMDGSANNFGTVLDVLGLSEDVQPIGIALNPNFGDRRFSETGRWWRRVCWIADPSAATRLVPDSLDGPYPEGDEVPLSTLIAAARARVDPPPLPAFGHSGPASLLQLPTWFWANQEWWENPYREEQSHGRVKVVVGAAPSSWQMVAGGVDAARCEGRGTTWKRGRDDRQGCTHTFSDAVEDGSVSLKFTVTMNVAWSASIAGYGVQALPPIYRSVDQSHEVIEVIGLRG